MGLEGFHLFFRGIPLILLLRTYTFEVPIKWASSAGVAGMMIGPSGSFFIHDCKVFKFFCERVFVCTTEIKVFWGKFQG